MRAEMGNRAGGRRDAVELERDRQARRGASAAGLTAFSSWGSPPLYAGAVMIVVAKGSALLLRRPDTYYREPDD